MFSVKNWLKLTVILVFITFLGTFVLYLTLRDELPDINSLKDVQWQTPMQIYSIDGALISQFGEKKRKPLTFDEIPQQLINALLATEDDRFYFHFGVDPIGMARAIFGQITGNSRGGASTITMQVARNFFLTREQTYIRKVREIFLSFHIESLLTKNEILTLYVNKIPLGHRSFGFGAAAQVYYGKEIEQLNLAQIAVLAGLPKAPSTYNPIRSIEKAKLRRTTVLQRMLVSGYITDQEYQQAKIAPITGKRHGANIELDAPYIAEMAHKEMLLRYGKEQAYAGGYKVFTTVTNKLQQAAHTAVTSNLLRYDQRHGYRGAVASLRPTEELTDITTSQTNDKAQSITNHLPLTADEIETALNNVTHYQMLAPAVVTQVNEKSVNITFRDNKEAIIPWAGMAWARPYINDQKQGQVPKVASEIFRYGDVILVNKTSTGEYRLSQLPIASAAIISLSPDNGAIKAAVGGFSFKQSQFNRVTQAKRQVGSNIKPFIYSAALENGFTLASLINDAPINQWDKSSGVVWRPKNSPETYVGPLRMRLALAQSKNVVAVRLLKSIGIGKTVDHLSSFGFSPDELPRNESLALGSASLTPLELVTGFATFANGGFIIEPYLIERIENAEGEVIYQANPELACDPCIASTEYDQYLEEMNPYDDEYSTSSLEDKNPISAPLVSAPRAISAQNAFLITQALNSAIWGADWSVENGWQGTGWRARTLERRDIGGKTGTTNEAKDAWFSGFTRRLVTTSWIGFDDPSRNLGKSVYNNNLGRNQITGKEFGAKSAQPAWISFMKIALTDIPFESFEPPAEIVSVRIDKATGKLTTKTNKSSLFEYFELGTVPTEYISTDNSADIFQSMEGVNNEEELF
ncbi:penicillin-binding protein 1A [Candidatus Colwellia aromaticivorans]|uniref:penicillin-binding protein 1A n=1 Tax=Candidatus Colwellia aromaticivorans TaxID=2267621 RepID=UPI000DF1DE8D|nr:penicillin-binding protein 1A [Candidatus Colwellia aromaticivorans]